MPQSTGYSCERRLRNVKPVSDKNGQGFVYSADPGVTEVHPSLRLPLKSVAFAPDGKNVFWRLGIFFELLAKPGNVHIHGAGGDEGLLFPNLFEDLFARKNLTTVIDEQPEKL